MVEASAPLTTKLEALGYKLHFINGPIALSKSELPPSFQSLYSEDDGNNQPPLRSWWVVNKKRPAEHYNLDRAFATIDAFAEKHGPFVGVIGFSQGASLAALLASRLVTLQSKQPETAKALLKFAILISGFVPNYAPLIDTYFSQPVALPSLHVLGSEDKVVPTARSRDLAAKFDTQRAVVITHPQGHVIPNDDASISSIAAFVAQHGDNGYAGSAKL